MNIFFFTYISIIFNFRCYVQMGNCTLTKEKLSRGSKRANLFDLPKNKLKKKIRRRINNIRRASKL